MRVIMTGGGTGGHIYPAIAIADEIKRRNPDATILFVGAEIGLEGELVPQCGYDIELIQADGFNRKNMLKNIDVVKRLRNGGKRSREIIAGFKPDVVIGTGGYASAPIMKAAQKAKIPTYIHEQNAMPGMANKMLESKVEKLFLGFENASQYFRHPEKHVVSGNPVRSDFMTVDREKARAELGFKPSDFVVFSFGGSQGAGRINKAMLSVIETFNGVKDIKICMATGGYYYDAVKDELKDKGIREGGSSNIIIIEYIKDMATYLAASDIVVCRSGALSVAEITVCGRPAIFIPSPMVTGNHQYYNAKAVADKGGAIIIEESEVDNDRLSDEILKLKNDPGMLSKMADRSRECAPIEATGIICDNIFGHMAE